MAAKPSVATIESDRRGALVAAARDGSVEALGLLLESARPQLLSIATRTIPATLRAKCGPSDIVQQTSIEAHQGIRDFAGESSAEFFGWLRAILRSNILDTVRRYHISRKRDVDREVSLDDPQRCPAPGDVAPVLRRPDDSAVRREEMLAVERALDTLSPDRRTAVWLRHWEGRSFADIGARLGTTDEAARKLWYRGVRQLGEALRGRRGGVVERSRSPGDAAT